MRVAICIIEKKGTARKRAGVLWLAGLLMVSWVSWGPTAHAEVLYEKEGVQLRGAARVVAYNAAVCRVSEENYTAERYEELKANEGHPLHVWQVDFSVYNGSGRALSYLRANFDIEAEHPPCTSWTGDGPGGGPSGGPYSGTVFWGSQSRTLSTTVGMSPAETKQGVLFLAVFHTDRPTFERWSTDFTYGEAEGGGRGAVPASGIAAPSSGPAESASGSPLPVEVMLDKYQLEAEMLMEEKDHKGALEAMDRIAALQRTHGLTLPEEFPFLYAKAALAAGSYQAAIDSANRYLSVAGRGGKFYREALGLLVKSERGLRAPADAVRRAASGADVRGSQRVRPQARQRLPYEPEMVEIPGGSFRMGCVSGQDCFDWEHPVHTVRVQRFELSKYEVTFEEYDRFTAATGRARADDEGWGRGRRPAINVSWDDAVAYTRWLSQQTGQRYRLPTEAEWEYAARAGTETKFHFGNDESQLCDHANHLDSSASRDALLYESRNRACSDGVGDRTAVVGRYRPNAHGLHDMHGNVWEWVQDCWNGSYRGAPTDGSAWQQGDCSQRVLRGGSWVSDPWDLRSALRSRITPSDRSWFNGFRVARTVTL